MLTVDKSVRKENLFIIQCFDFFITGKTFTCPEQMDWNYIIMTSAQHRIIPVLCSYVNNASLEIPANLTRELRTANQAIKFNCVMLTKELMNVLSIFKKNHITAVPFKGPILSNSAYGNFAAREYTDLDILIDKSDLSKVKKVLEGLEGNFQSAGNSNDHAYSFSMIKKNSIINFDIHWEFAEHTYGFKYAGKEVFSRLKKINLFDNEISCLSPEDTLLTMVMHHGKNSWNELRFVADLSGLITREKGLDWNFIITKSNDIGIKRYLFLGIYLAKETFTIRLPRWLEKVVTDDTEICNLGNSIIERYLSESKPYTAGDMKFDFYLQKSLSPTLDLSYFIREKFTDFINPNTVDKQVIKLPSKLYFIYYLIRFCRLVRTYGINRILLTATRLFKVMFNGFLKR